MLSSQPSGEQLVTKDRQLVYKGILKLLDSKAKACHELHVFLFTDILLLTELVKANKKEVSYWYIRTCMYTCLRILYSVGFLVYT